MDDFTRGNRHSLAAIRTDIRGQLDAAKFVEERITLLDIKAQKLRCQAAMQFFESFGQIKAACQRREIAVGNWCKDELGCGVKHLRKLRQLHKRWDDYIAQRQSYDGDRYGLRLAFTLVGIPTDGESNAPTVGDQNGTDQDTGDSLDSGRFVLTPPEVWAMIVREFGKTWDACPHPLPDGHDALTMDWPEDAKVIYMNAPFTKKGELHGRGLIEFARKAIAEHKKGKTVIMAMPIRSVTNMLLEAGAEVRPLGRVAWRHAETGKPWPSPGYSALFILRAKKRRVRAGVRGIDERHP